MEIKGMMAAQKYAAAKPVTDARQPASAMEAALQTAQDFAATLARGEETATASMVGGADPHSLVTALAQTELVVETAVTVRNRVVEAYQEILRMPV
ncbi:MAG: flagellar hook-basal body complex protein FliE [Pseudomonadota bacterium]